MAGREALIREIQVNDTTILLGETGSGKTTRASASHNPTAIAPHNSILSTEVPQYILESGIAGKGMIAVTQPRRVAATSLAARVAAEKNVSVGGLVGYSVRFDEASSSDTRIKYVSDGMLVRELLSDRLLSRYSVIVVDEAHERTLRTDFLIANLKTIQTARNSGGDVNGKGKGPASALNPLKLIIMSATLDAEKFSKFYNKLVDYFRTQRICLWETPVLEYSMSRVGNTLSRYSIHQLARQTMLMLLCGRSSKSILIDLQEMSLYFFQVCVLICQHRPY